MRPSSTRARRPPRARRRRSTRSDRHGGVRCGRGCRPAPEHRHGRRCVRPGPRGAHRLAGPVRPGCGGDPCGPPCSPAGAPTSPTRWTTTCTVGAAPTSAGARARDRARHGPRAPGHQCALRSAGAGAAVPVPEPVLLCDGRTRRWTCRSTSCNGSTGSCSAPERPAGRARGRRPALTDRLVDTLAALHAVDPRRTPVWPTSADRTGSPAGSWHAGGVSSRRAVAVRSRASTSCATRSDAAVPAAQRATVRPRRLPARQRAGPAGRLAHRGGAGLGDGHPRRPADRPRPDARLLGRRIPAATALSAIADTPSSVAGFARGPTWPSATPRPPAWT